MDSPKLTVSECLEESRRLRDAHARELAAAKRVLRDDFAAHALVALLPIGPREWKERYGDIAVATMAYTWADVMLLTREDKG